MRSLKVLLSAALALTITVCTVPANASAITLNSDIYEISEGEVYCAKQNSFENVEAASQYMKECIKKREKKITFSLPDTYEFEDVSREVIRQSFAETNEGCEGDYIRMTLNNYKCSGTHSSANNVWGFVYEMTYRTTLEQEEYVDQKTKEILDSLKLDGKDDYTKLKKIYEYIINNVGYDYESRESEVFTAYGALYNHKAVCQGLAHLFYRLTKDAGIDCRMIRGDAGGAHVWNIAAVDGIYYLFDSTWDIFNTNVDDCFYFMKGTIDFDEHDRTKPHIAESGDEMKSPYNVNYDSNVFKARYPVAVNAYAPSTPDTKCCIGDVNADSYVDSSDASLILAAYSKMSVGGSSGLSKEQEKAADVNHDKSIDSSDASSVLKYYALVSTGGTIKPADFFK